MGSIYSGDKSGQPPSLSPRIVPVVEVPQVVEKPVFHVTDASSEPVEKPQFHVVICESTPVEKPAFHVVDLPSQAIGRPQYEIYDDKPQRISKPVFHIEEHVFAVHKPRYEVVEKTEVIEKPGFASTDNSPVYWLVWLIFILQLVEMGVIVWGSK